MALAVGLSSSSYAEENNTSCSTPLIGGAFHLAAATEAVGYTLAYSVGGDVNQLLDRGMVPYLFNTLVATNPYFADLPSDLAATEALRQAQLDIQNVLENNRGKNFTSATFKETLSVMRNAMLARNVDPVVIEAVMEMAANTDYEIEHFRADDGGIYIIDFPEGAINCTTPFNTIPEAS